MKIAIIIEGKTEKVFMSYLREYLKSHLSKRMPNLDPVPYNGRIPMGNKLKRVVEKLLYNGKSSADHVIALTDVYTGSKPPDFKDAADAIKKMREWVGSEPKFHPHAAQYDFEAWLIPYWGTIQKLAGHKLRAPTGKPEQVNHGNPPAHRINEIFEIGKCRDSYVKPRDAGRILKDNDLSVAISKCPQLKNFVNTIIFLSSGKVIQ